MESSGFGKLMVWFGLSIAAIGTLLILLGRWPNASSVWGWLGRLPGDILVKRENFTFYFPLATSILLSVIVSLLLYFFLKR